MHFRACESHAVNMRLGVACLALLHAGAAATAAGGCPWTPSAVSASVEPLQQLDLTGLPGFTRSGYAQDHALITPESRVYAPLFGWRNSRGAVLVSPKATGAHFTMYLIEMDANASSAAPLRGVERFAYVLAGALQVRAGEEAHSVEADGFAYFPAEQTHTLSSAGGATVLMYEQRYVEPAGTMAAIVNGSRPTLVVGRTDAQTLVDVSPEVFELRKLLPTTPEYDFNMHVMDFQPGEFLMVKEIHYNQHGLLLMEGQGIYRLADKWYPVKAGDAVWMAPFVVQWYGALGKTRSRYIINKDTNRDPLQV